MLEFSPIFGMTDEVELTDTELEAIHGGRGRHHGGGYFGNPYGGFNGYGYIPTEVLLLTPTTIVPSDVSTAPSTTDSTTTTAPSTAALTTSAAPTITPSTTTAPSSTTATPPTPLVL